MRQWLNQNSTLTAGAAVALLAGALTLVVLQARGDAVPETQVYFWDLEADEAFVAGANAIPPIEAPSGEAGARAHLFSCGACEPGEWFGYLERYTDEAKQLYEQAGELPEADPIRVRDLRGGPWVRFESDDAADILDGIYRHCDDPVECLP